MERADSDHATDRPAIGSAGSGREEIQLIDYLNIFMRHRRLIGYNTLIITAVALIIAFVIPKRYVAFSSILPPEEEPQLGLSSVLGEMGIGALLLGGQSRSSAVFTEILLSDRVLREMIDEFNLVDVYDYSGLYAQKPGWALTYAREELIENTVIDLSEETGVLRVYVEDEDPQRAANMANRYIEKLDQINRTVNMSTGMKNRVFLEGRLDQIKKDLAAAEQKLQTFQDEHGILSIEEEITVALQAAAGLRTQYIANQIKLETLREIYSPAHPMVRQLENENSKIQAQLRGMESGGDGEDLERFTVPFREVPAMALEYLRLLRDVEVQETIYRFLVPELEKAKIQEVRDVSTIQVLDAATPPAIKEWPKRSIIVAGAFFLSLVIGMTMAILLDFKSRVDSGKVERSDDWRGLFETIRADSRKLSAIFRKSGSTSR